VLILLATLLAAACIRGIRAPRKREQRRSGWDPWPCGRSATAGDAILASTSGSATRETARVYLTFSHIF